MMLWRRPKDDRARGPTSCLGAVDKLGDGVSQMGQAEPGGMVTDPVGGQHVHGFSFWLAAWA